MSEINDIAPITTSQYGSLLELLIYVIVALLLFILFYLLGKFMRSKREEQRCVFDTLNLESIDKEELYNFTIIAKKAKSCEGLESLLEKLEPYKYKAESEAISKEIANEIREYVEKCRV
ncbi:MAG TPA: hypothetical protein ENL00_04795 [Nitratifractor sp.]|jgi:hypothetical protein|nr:hypothetical protein [Nitratifractor sp.]HHD75117.1 hypothetical protein [Nitratifractor sp.]